jgi:hypothetical protein
VDEDIGALGESDQVIVHRGVAGEHHGAVRGVETVRQSRNGVAVGYRDGGDPDNVVAEDEDRSLREALGAAREGDVDAADERARIWHAGVKRHDVQMVGVAREDAFHQVRRARERAVSAGPDAPRVEQQAGQVTDVVGMKMGEEHGFRPRAWVRRPFRVAPIRSSCSLP